MASARTGGNSARIMHSLRHAELLTIVVGIWVQPLLRYAIHTWLRIARVAVSVGHLGLICELRLLLHCCRGHMWTARVSIWGTARHLTLVLEWRHVGVAAWLIRHRGIWAGRVHGRITGCETATSPSIRWETSIHVHVLIAHVAVGGLGGLATQVLGLGKVLRRH
jgi:hypothetical protein